GGLVRSGVARRCPRRDDDPDLLRGEPLHQSRLPAVPRGGRGRRRVGRRDLERLPPVEEDRRPRRDLRGQLRTAQLLQPSRDLHLSAVVRGDPERPDPGGGRRRRALARGADDGRARDLGRPTGDPCRARVGRRRERGRPAGARVAELTLIPREEFGRAGGDLALLADMCRANALVAVKRAGSGHLGSSFSALDVVVHLLWRELNVAELGWQHPDRDVFFSSKGHDAPGLYAALNALGVIPTDRLLRLRRLGGLDGHPDIRVPGIEANSGSLGMGLSKGRGMAWAKRFLDRKGRVVVMTGDGELQEGQNWEAFAAAAHQRLGNLWAIVDRNELQSDKRTDEVLGLGDLEAKLRAFGWHVQTCDGHDHDALAAAFAAMRASG